MALTNVTQFNLGIDRFIDGAEERRKDLTRATALRALSGVHKDTRADTGRARGNWQASEGEPAVGAIERFDQGGSMGSLDTFQIEARKILRFSGEDIIWLHNGVPYIGFLERLDKMLAGNVEALKTWLRSQR